MNINGETKLVGFIGSTYKTSKMYAMYNAAFKALNLNFIYVPFTVDDIGKAMDAIRHLGIHATGVTVPFKISILPFLDELDDNARRIGAVNVVVNRNSKLIGGNTDGIGGVLALKEKTEVKGKQVLLLGAGGVARALAFALKDNSATVTILNRTSQDANNLSKLVGCQFDNLDTVQHRIKGADILINATSVGMAPDVDVSLVPKTLLRPDIVVQEVVSNPKETQLLKDAKAKGCTVVLANRMLFWQAVLKFKLYTGVDAPISVMEKALKDTEQLWQEIHLDNYFA